MVRMWHALVSLMRSMMAASVVDFPEPVGPVTRTKPRGRVASHSAVGGRSSSSKLGIRDGIIRSASAVSPRWVNALPRRRARSSQENAKSTSCSDVEGRRLRRFDDCSDKRVDLFSRKDLELLRPAAASRSLGCEALNRPRARGRNPFGPRGSPAMERWLRYRHVAQIRRFLEKVGRRRARPEGRALRIVLDVVALTCYELLVDCVAAGGAGLGVVLDPPQHQSQERQCPSRRRHQLRQPQHQCAWAMPMK